MKLSPYNSFPKKNSYPCIFLLYFPQQALPEENYTTEDHDVFTISGRTCIEEGNGAQVLSIVLDDRNQV